MRPDQITTLGALEEQLVDLFTYECTPKKWLAVKDIAERDAGYKEKKVALATMQLIGRVQNVLRDLRDIERDPQDQKDRKEQKNTVKDGDPIEADIARLRKIGNAVLIKHGIKPN